MDSEIIYTLMGVAIFGVIAYFVLQSDVSKEIQSKDERRCDIMNAYEKELREALEAIKDDEKARVSKKSELLKKFSDELVLNIFFDEMDIKDIITELSYKS